MPELIILSGKLKGKRLVLPPKEMVVGRDEDCDLRIASSLVSRRHCTLLNTPDGIRVTDLSSQNGTHVNDVPITEPILLKEGDTLRIGATLLAVPSQTRIKLPPENQTEISESEIADWLTEPSANFSSTDTAVISLPKPESQKAPEPKSQPTPPHAPPPSGPAAAAARQPGSRPLSIKEEAAEVIRKHWEKIKAKQGR